MFVPPRSFVAGVQPCLLYLPFFLSDATSGWGFLSTLHSLSPPSSRRMTDIVLVFSAGPFWWQFFQFILRVSAVSDLWRVGRVMHCLLLVVGFHVFFVLCLSFVCCSYHGCLSILWLHVRTCHLPRISNGLSRSLINFFGCALLSPPPVLLLNAYPPPFCTQHLLG